MAHAQKPDFVFRRNGRVHLNRRGRQFSRLLAAEVCASAVVMLDTPRYEVVWEYWLPTPFASFPFTSPPVRHRVPSGFKRTLHLPPSSFFSLWLIWRNCHVLHCVPSTVDGDWIRTSEGWLRESETRSEVWPIVALSPANSTWTTYFDTGCHWSETCD